MIDQSEIKNHYTHEIVGACYRENNGEPYCYAIVCLDCELTLMSDEPTEQRGN